MVQLIVTVTPNPALDMTWVADEVLPGASHRVNAARVRAGGKGLNVARVAHSQAPTHVQRVVAVTTCGGAVGAEFAAELAQHDLPHTLVPVAAATRRSIAVYDAAAADTLIFNEHGVAPTHAEWGALVAAVDDAFAAAEPFASAVLVIAGSLPPGVGEAQLLGLMQPARARDIPVIVDTSGPLLLAAAHAGATLLKPNLEELQLATGCVHPMQGMAALLAQGAGAVLCSLGAEGMLFTAASHPGEREGLQARRAKLPTPLRGNPTGAGDAAVAAAAVLIAAGCEPGSDEILRRSAAWSAAAVLMPLAGEISPAHQELESELLCDVVTARDLAGVAEAGGPMQSPPSATEPTVATASEGDPA